MGFKNDYGSNMFAKNLWQYNLFAGTQFNKYFGAEASLFTTQNKKRSVTIGDGETALGFADFAGIAGSDSYDTKTRLAGGTIQATARYPLARKVSIFASAGIGIAQLKVQADMTADGGAAPTQAQINGNQIDQSQTKVYPMIGAGLDWKFAKHLGTRVDIAWENTSQFKKSFQTTPPGVAARDLQYKAKDSVVYGLSIYAYM